MLFNSSPLGLFLLATAWLQPCYGFHVRQEQQRLPCSAISLFQESSSGFIEEKTDSFDASVSSRRDLFRNSVAVAFALLLNEGSSNQPAFAFDGSGASASSGYSPATKAEKKKKFQERVAADVKDFKALGKAIDKGETDGPEWVNFFILFQRREPDEVGRTYAALADLRGLPGKKKGEYEGGDGLLLANTFTKPGKPPDNTPAVKSFLKLSKTFDAIEAAGKAKDAAKAKKEWQKTSELFSQYLSDVELPGDLNDSLYK